MTLPDACFTFGKHRGLLVSTVARSAPGYLLWVASIKPTRADPKLWAAVRAHLPLAAELLEQRDQAEREVLERRRARRQARETPPQGTGPGASHLGKADAFRSRLNGDSIRDSRIVRIEDLV